MPRTIRKIIIHHTEGKKDTYKSVYDWQTTKDDPDTPEKEGMGWSHVAYHKIIERSGKVFDTYGEDKASGGTKSNSFDSLEVCLCGDFDDQTPTPESIFSLKKILVDWCCKYNIVPSEGTIVGHKDVQAKKGESINRCPGENLHSQIPELITYTASEVAKRNIASALKKMSA